MLSLLCTEQDGKPLRKAHRHQGVVLGAEWGAEDSRLLFTPGLNHCCVTVLRQHLTQALVCFVCCCVAIQSHIGSCPLFSTWLIHGRQISQASSELQSGPEVGAIRRGVSSRSVIFPLLPKGTVFPCRSPKIGLNIPPVHLCQSLFSFSRSDELLPKVDQTLKRNN